MKNPRLIKFINPKYIIYGYYLSIAELDKAKSESLVQTIQSGRKFYLGETSYIDKAINEEDLLEKFNDYMKKEKLK